MNSVNNSHSPRRETYNSPETFESTNLRRSALDLRTSAGISIVTADGDKVTLSANSSIQARLQSYDYQGRIQGQTIAVHGEEFALSNSSGLALTVDGELDQDELADINKLIDALASASNDFFAGKIDAGLEQLAQLDDMDSIAGFDAAFSYSREISTLSTSQVSSLAPAQTGARPNSAAPAQIKSVDSFMEQLAQAAKLLESANIFDIVPPRFRQLFEKLAHDMPLEEHEHGQAERIRSESSKRGRDHHADSPTP